MLRLLRRLRARIKYRHFERDLREELDTHRALTEDALEHGGLPKADARWRAARLVGNSTLAREDARQVWIARWFDELRQDVRYAVRGLCREWGFTITASVTFALGLGVLIGVFTVFNAVFLKPWPLRAPQQVFGVSEALADPRPSEWSGPARRVSHGVWEHLRTAMVSADLAAKYDALETLRLAATGPGRSGRFLLVNDGFLETLGVPLQMGVLSATSGTPAIVISDAVWKHDMAADPSVMGRTIWLGSHAVVITGVLDPKFRGFPPETCDGILLFTPETSAWLFKGGKTATSVLTAPTVFFPELLGRLRPGYTRMQAAQEIEVRANAAHAASGLPALKTISWDTTVAGRPGGVKGSVPALFALLFTGCAIVTLLACANIGNLQLARGLRRAREVSVRLALGAGRRRLIRQFMTESAILALFGTFGGLVMAWTVPSAIMSFDISTSLVFTPDATVVAFALVVAIVATILSGLPPALRATRIEWRGSASTVSPDAARLRGLLLATQIALSLGLIASASLLSRGALRVAGGAGAGFDVRGVNADILAVTTPDDTEAGKTRRAAVAQAVAAIPGIALVDAAPLSNSHDEVKLVVPGKSEPVTAEFAGFNRSAIAMLRIPLIAGRWHSDDKGLREATVTRSLARALWNQEDVIGRTFVAFGQTQPYEVVGVIDEVWLVDPTFRPAAILAPHTPYLPTVLSQPGSDAQLKAVVASIDPTIRVMSRPLLDSLKKLMKNSFIGVSVASGLGVVALLLASLGVFGVFAYIVEERRREIGVRLALGASRAQVRRSVLSATRSPIIYGLAAGLALAIVSGNVLRSNLFGLSILDPLSYIAAAVILGAAAVLATFIPLRRALRVDPAVTLRSE